MLVNPLLGSAGLNLVTDLNPASFGVFDRMLEGTAMWSRARSIAADPASLTRLFSSIDANAGQIAKIGLEHGIENGPKVLKEGVTALMKGFSEGGATGLMGALKGLMAKTPGFLGFLKSVSNLVPGLGLVVSLATQLPTLLNPNATAAQKTAALLGIAGGVCGLVPGWGAVASTALNVASIGTTVLQNPIDNVMTKVGTSMGLSINGMPPHMDFEREANELIAKFERQGNRMPPVRVQGGRFGGV